MSALDNDDFADQLDGRAEIFRLIRHGNLEQLLDWQQSKPVQFKQHINSCVGHMGRTPLHAAVMVDNLAIVQLLLAAGANIEQSRDRNDSPIFWAKSVAVADCLFQHGANINRRDDFNRAPIHWAAQFSLAPLIEFFIQHGNQPNWQSQSGQTPLHEATGTTSFNIIEITKIAALDCVKVLLKHGAKVNLQDNDGNVPLQGVVVLPNMEQRLLDGQLKYQPELPQAMLEIVRIMLEQGADPNIKNNQGLSPVDRASPIIKDLMAK